MSSPQAEAAIALPDLLDALPEHDLHPVTPLVDARPVRAITPVSTASDVAAAPAGALLVVMPGWDAELTGYRVDVVLRQAADAGAVAVLFTAPRRPGASALHLAARAGLVLLVCAPAGSAWQLVFDLDRVRRRSAPRVSTAVLEAVGDIDAVAAGAHGTEHDLLAVGTRLLGAPVHLRPAGLDVDWRTTTAIERTTDGLRVLVRSFRPAWLSVPVTGPLAEVLLPLLGARIGLVADRRLDPALSELRARSQLVLGMLLADRAKVADIARAALALGVPVPATHVGVVLTAAARALPARRFRDLVVALEIDLLDNPDVDGGWHLTVTVDGIVLVRSGREPVAVLRHAARVRVAEFLARYSTAEHRLSVGIGTPATGADGLRQTVAEARLARLSAEDAGRADGVAEADRAGLRRVLADINASPFSSDALAGTLGSLDALPADRATIAVHTLNAWLDAQGSLKRAAAALHLHPNAVAYRLAWIRDALDADLDDPDQRLAVHIACRSRLQHDPA